MIRTKYIGLVDGLETYEVTDTETGEVIGYNQSVPTEVTDGVS